VPPPPPPPPPPPSFCVRFTTMMYHYQVSRYLECKSAESVDRTHIIRSRDRSLGIVTGYGLDGQGLNTGRGRLALGPTHPPIQWLPGSLSLGIKRSGHEVDHSPLSSAKVKNGGTVRPFTHMSSWQCLLINTRITLPLPFPVI
jgi:hypothetical protein